MKKLFAIVLALTMAVCLFGCANTPATTDPVATDPVVTDPVVTDPVVTDPVATDPVEDINAKSEGVMTYAEYAAAEMDNEVTVEFYVQATQGWWFDNDAGHGKITIYGQDGNGGYFSYETICDEETAQDVVPGAKVRITGYKGEWAGEVEIMDGAVEVLDGYYLAEALDVTDLLGSEELVNHQNMLVSFKGMTFVSMEYKDNTQGNDIYVTVSRDGAEYSFCVESYLTGAESETYKAVEALQAGDVVDIEGFLYWYNGANPHITSVKAAA